MALIAIDPYLETNIILPVERLNQAKNMVTWGEKNNYPFYIQDLYLSSPTLKTCIDGTRDYIAGDDCVIAPLPNLPVNVMNKKGDTIREQVADLAKDHEEFGGFCLQIIRNLAGEVAEIYHIDMRYIRMNKECDVFYYSEDWNKSQGKKNATTYPAFMPFLDWKSLDEDAKKLHLTSILFVKADKTATYPIPKFIASVPDAEIERCIASYHLNNLENGFAPAVVINFNNGIPSPEIQEEVEKNITEKFSGHQNAGRVMCCWNESKDAQTTLREVKVDDFSAKYDALSKSSKQRIFTAFRANPNLFGVPTESNGFNAEEYESAFKLFNRTQVKPVQRMICDAYDKIYGSQNVLTIVPFSLAGEAESNVQ